MAKNPLHQPNLRIRLHNQTENQAYLFGLIGLQARLMLHLETVDPHRYREIEFIVDSGAFGTIIGLEFAMRYNLSVPPPQSEVPLRLGGVNGRQEVLVRPGRMRCWWNANREGYPFDWPVLFRVDAPLNVPPLLGLGGVIPTCRWIIEGTSTPVIPYGSIEMQDIR